MILKLKTKILEIYPSQIVAAKDLDFEEARLSKIIRGHVTPNAAERQKLVAAFGAAALRPIVKTVQHSGSEAAHV